MSTTTVVLKLLTVISAAVSLHAWAIEDRADVDPSDPPKAGRDVAWKTTFSSYRDTTSGSAYDLNLRGNSGRSTFWIGEYKAQDGFEQFRAGLEYGLPLGGSGRMVGSFQVASGGFLGGSLTWDGRQESSHGWAPLLGLGRTNARPYYNLNFDPNDSVMVGGTYTRPSGDTAMVYQIRDNRLGTGQRVTHLVWRTSSGVNRLTLDGYTRQGAAAAGEPSFRGSGLTATWDIGDWFLRAGRDGRANYTPSDIVRLGAGVRF